MKKIDLRTAADIVTIGLVRKEDRHELAYIRRQQLEAGLIILHDDDESSLPMSLLLTTMNILYTHTKKQQHYSDGRIYLNLFKSIQSAAGLKALKPGCQ